MEVKIKYLGVLAELTGLQEEKIPFLSGNISDVLRIVLKKYPKMEDYDFRVAQNKKLVDRETAVDGTEIAFLPPFAGG